MAWSLIALAEAAMNQGDYAREAALEDESLALFREVDDTRGAALALHILALALGRQGFVARPVALEEESLALCRQEGHRWLSALSLNHMGFLALTSGQTEKARALLEESLAIHHEFGNKAASAFTLQGLGILAVRRSDHARAIALFKESLALSRECGDKYRSSEVHEHLGISALGRGEYERARASFEEALALRKELLVGAGDLWNEGLLDLARVAQAQGDHRTVLEEGLAGLPELDRKRELSNQLGRLGLQVGVRGDCDRARALYQESLLLRREVGDQLALAQSLEEFAGLAARQGQARRAAQLLGAAEAQCEAIGASPPALPAEYNATVERIRVALSEEAFAAARAEGRALSLDEAVVCALENAAPV